MMEKIYFIRAEWDDEAAVWVATSDDVPGLATEAESIDALSKKLEVLVPELLEANGLGQGREVPYELLARKLSVAHPNAI
jgi:predicted RNase H-like HicB family nuclease